MSLLVQSGYYISPTASGDFTVSCSFKPVAVLIYAARGSLAGTGADIVWTFSTLDTTTNNRSVSFTSRNNTSVPSGSINGSLVSGETETGYVTVLPDPANPVNTFNADASVVGFSANAFKIHYYTSTQYYLNYVALGGDVVSSSFWYSLPPTSNGTLTLSNPGFQPDLGFVYNAVDSTALPQHPINYDVRHLIGWSSGSSGSYSAMRIKSAASPTSASSVQKTNMMYGILGDSGIIREANFSGFTSTGYTLNYTKTDGTQPYFMYGALKGGKYWVSSFTGSTVTGNQSITDCPFTPKFVIIQSACNASSTNVISSGSFAFGWGQSSTTQSAASVWSHNAIVSGTVTSQSSAYTQSAIINAQSRYRGLGNVANLTAMTSNGLNWQTVDSLSREYIYVAFGDSTSAVTPSTPTVFSILYSFD